MDRRIMMFRQVFFNNEWVNVKSFDRTPNMICGNSFMHQKIIYSKSHFTFIAPCLEGDINVKSRFVIALKEEGEYTLIFSNEFEGYINKELIE